MGAIRVGNWKYISYRTMGYAGWAEAPESGAKNHQFLILRTLGMLCMTWPQTLRRENPV